MVETGRTLALAVRVLRQAGASQIYAAIAHGEPRSIRCTQCLLTTRCTRSPLPSDCDQNLRPRFEADCFRQHGAHGIPCGRPRTGAVPDRCRADHRRKHSTNAQWVRRNRASCMTCYADVARMQRISITALCSGEGRFAGNGDARRLNPLSGGGEARFGSIYAPSMPVFWASSAFRKDLSACRAHTLRREWCSAPFRRPTQYGYGSNARRWRRRACSVALDEIFPHRKTLFLTGFGHCLCPWLEPALGKRSGFQHGQVTYRSVAWPAYSILRKLIQCGWISNERLVFGTVGARHPLSKLLED